MGGRAIRLGEVRRMRETADGGLEISPATTYGALAAAALPGGLAAVAARCGDGTIGSGVCAAAPGDAMNRFLLEAGAVFTLASRRGRRVVAAAAFFAPACGTALARDEILLAITLPASTMR
jgi:CO/xanthine dehydrogenase FAD-binding subunit